jgi:hypothetical protein
MLLVSDFGLVVAQFAYAYKRTEAPTPFSTSGDFPAQPAGGSAYVNYVWTLQNNLALNKDYYQSLFPRVTRADVHTEEGSPLKGSDHYVVHGTSNMSMKTTLKFPVPSVLSTNLENDNQRLLTLTIEIDAKWPLRGGGRFVDCILDVTSSIAGAVISAPSLGTRAQIYKIVAVGTVRMLRSLASFFTLTISWDTVSWYEGEDSYGFDIVYSVTAYDVEVKAAASGTSSTTGIEAIDACDGLRNLCVEEEAGGELAKPPSTVSEASTGFSSYSIVSADEGL